MYYSIDIKEKAILLRKKGYSVKEIAKILNIAVGTSSLWLKEIKLDDQAKKRLLKRRVLGQYNANQTKKAKKELIRTALEENIFSSLKKIKFNINLYKLLCSIFFWTEGGKFTDSHLYFINSDPKMVEVFMKLLRLAFQLDEQKFRALIHVHEYHNEEKIKQYWSKITGIPISQFNRSYLKPNTKKRIRESYQGCISIRYYDYKVALELRAFYNSLAKLI